MRDSRRTTTFFLRCFSPFVFLFHIIVLILHLFQVFFVFFVFCSFVATWGQHYNNIDLCTFNHFYPYYMFSISICHVKYQYPTSFSDFFETFNCALNSNFLILMFRSLLIFLLGEIIVHIFELLGHEKPCFLRWLRRMEQSSPVV